jgi:O-antigen/teichoic acid export membrane protein
MIRATAISVVDQCLLSALSFVLALALIRFGSQQDYGLYTQLMGLQSLFSVLHAGLFVSAYLAMLPRLAGAARSAYQAGMARAEFGVTLLLALVGAALTWCVAIWIGHPVALATSAAAALALLGLWWREFTRARHFAEGSALRVLRMDFAYAVLVAGGLAWMILARATTAEAVLWCMGIAGVAVAVVPIARQARTASVDGQQIRHSVAHSWISARWEVLTSLVTWGHAQSFVYFAALQGGLSAAAEVSGARLLTMPLALVWLSYANILRPEASRLLGEGDGVARLNRLAWRSAQFVLALALVYGVALTAALPLLERHVFGAEFQHLGSLTLLWLAYFALTGLTTIATSLLRSAFEFKALFRIHLFCAVIAVSCFCAGLGARTPAVFVVALVLVEAVLAIACWRKLRARLHGAAPLSLRGMSGA